MPFIVNGHVTEPCVAVPVAAQGIVVALLMLATTVPARLIPPAQVPVKSPVICVLVWDVIFHCTPPHVWGVAKLVAVGPLQVPRYDRTSEDDESLALSGFFSYFNRDPMNIRNQPGIGGGALMDIGCYRGLRHRKGLPVNGQRTHTNARTRKGPRKGLVSRAVRKPAP